MSQVLRITEKRRVVREAGEFGRVVVLFGGCPSSAQSDTWEYDGVTWQQITTANVPRSRGLGVRRPGRGPGRRTVSDPPACASST